MLDEPTEEELDEHLAETILAIQQATQAVPTPSEATSSAPPLSLATPHDSVSTVAQSLIGTSLERSQSGSQLRPDPASSAHNFDVLVNIRRKHQTHFAAAAIRTQNNGLGHQQPGSEKQPSLRATIVSKFYEVRRKVQDRAPTTGVPREIHWKGKSLAGNSANAAAVANAAAKKVCRQHGSCCTVLSY